MAKRINNRNRLIKNLYWDGGVTPLLLLAGIIGSGSSFSNPTGYGTSTLEVPKNLSNPSSTSTTGGSGLTAASGLQMASGAMNILGDAIGNSKIADTSTLEGAIDYLKGFGVGDVNTSKDELMNTWENFNPLKNVSWKDVRGGNAGTAALNAGKSALTGASAGMALGPIGAGVGAVIGGLVSGIGSLFGRRKAKKKAKELNAKIDEANALASRNLNTTANNINTQDFYNNLANVAAYGGFLPTFGSLALNYDLASRDLDNKEIDSMSKLRLVSLPNYVDEFDSIDTEFAKGGKIHIKPENRGKFNALKKRTGKTTEELTHSKNPLTRKRAIFALNAKKWKHADGGVLNTHGSTFTDGLVYINEGGSHELNPNEGVPIGVSPDGTPNLVEEGEVIFNDYVFSNRLKAGGGLLESFLLPKSLEGKTFADIAKYLNKDSEERPNDPISKRGLDENMNRLRDAQEDIKLRESKGNIFAGGGYFSIPEEELDSNVDAESDALIQAYRNMLSAPKSKGLSLDMLRFTPALGAGIGVFGDLLGNNRPDYSNADLVMSQANSIPNTEFNPIGDYLTYRPLDRLYFLNQLNANAAASRRAIENSANNRGAAMAGILAADYNANNAVGNLARQAEEYNAQLRERVAGFNRQTNMFNSEGQLKAEAANRQADELRLKAAMSAAQLRDLENMRSSLIRSANLTNLFDSLGDIGRELFAMNMINENPALYYGIDWRGKTSYNKKSKGGKIKKGLTY